MIYCAPMKQVRISDAHHRAAEREGKRHKSISFPSGIGIQGMVAILLQEALDARRKPKKKGAQS